VRLSKGNEWIALLQVNTRVDALVVKFIASFDCVNFPSSLSSSHSHRFLIRCEEEQKDFQKRGKKHALSATVTQESNTQSTVFQHAKDTFSNENSFFRLL
jgi:hypothetical protein